MKEYFEKKAIELGLNVVEAEKDFSAYIERFPAYKVTKGNITKFLKSMLVEPSNLEVESHHQATGTYIGRDPVTGEKRFA